MLQCTKCGNTVEQNSGWICCPKCLTELPSWKLLNRKEKTFKGKQIFYERWVEKSTKSGIVFLSGVKETGESVFIVEGYGIGTINPKNFKPIAKSAPIQRYELTSEQEGREILTQLQEFNYRLAHGETYEDLKKIFPKI